MPFTRNVMKFLVPFERVSLGRNDLVGRDIVPFYINPTSFKITEKKIIKEQLTKGGYSIQYWGEELPSISVSGSTGSGGIEAVHILRDVYRNEIIQFNRILEARANNVQDDFVTALDSASGSRATLDERWAVLKEDITNFTSGYIDEFLRGNPSSVELIPTMGAYATNVILFWSGETFQGYFTSFDVDESAASPGIFDYSFGFTVLKRGGKRKNFMPWHRNPRDFSGNPISASLPTEGPKPEELTFPYENGNVRSFQQNLQDSSNASNTSQTSRFTSTQDGSSDKNDVGVNRRNSFGKS